MNKYFIVLYFFEFILKNMMLVICSKVRFIKIGFVLKFYIYISMFIECYYYDIM